MHAHGLHLCAHARDARVSFLPNEYARAAQNTVSHALDMGSGRAVLPYYECQYADKVKNREPMWTSHKCMTVITVSAPRTRN